MAEQLADATPSAAPAAGRRVMTRKIIVALGLVLVAQALFALCLVSAQQLLVPRNMPFGVAGPPSPVAAAVTSKVGLDLSAYPSQSAAVNAINQGELYGAYVTGGSSDTLVVVPAKSFSPRPSWSRRSWSRHINWAARSRCRRLSRCRRAIRSAR